MKTLCAFAILLAAPIAASDGGLELSTRGVTSPASDAAAAATSSSTPTAAPSASTLKACALLESRGLVSVRCHGAVGDGKIDDTAAFRRAIAAARRGAMTLFVPMGRYPMSSPLDVTGVPVVGWGHRSSIRVSAAVKSPISAVLFARSGPALIDRIAIMAEDRARAALHVADSSNAHTIVRRLSAVQGVKAGVHLERVAHARLESVGGYNSGTGILIEQSSALDLRDLHVVHNRGDGVIIQGDAPFPTASKANELAGVRLTHADIEQNGGNAATFKNVRRPSAAQYLWIENGGNGVTLENVHAMTVRYARAIGGAGPNRAFALTKGSSGNVLEANSANHTASGPDAIRKWYAYSNSVFMEADCRQNLIIGNVLDSDNTRLPLVVIGGERTTRVNGDTRYEGGGATSGMITFRASPPSTGTWRLGDFVLSDRPMKDGVRGWVCDVQPAAGRCQWAPLASPRPHTTQ
jgi:hypothetical protein